MLRTDRNAVSADRLVCKAITIRAVKPSFEIGPVQIGAEQLFLIAGPCVIESEAHVRKMAEAIQRIADDLGIPYIFKASYDKANRTSVKSFEVLGCWRARASWGGWRRIRACRCSPMCMTRRSAR